MMLVKPKITTEDAELIRAAYRPREMTQGALAARHGMTQAAVSKVIRGDRWRGAGGPTSAHNGHHARRGEEAGAAKLSEAQVREIRDLWRRGWSHARTAGHYGVSATCIQAVRAGRSWRHVPDDPVYAGRPGV